MQIRYANTEDARRISYLIQKNTANVPENNYSQEQMTAWKRANSPKAIRESMKRRIIFCAFENKKLVGTIGLKENKVVGLYVSYSRRKSGIGRKLLTHLETHARTHGLKELVLTSTPSAKNFYTSNGFEIIKPVIVTILNVHFHETLMRKTF
ncbi:MAG TPA: GNAT family N-acetyltransferase [Eudoraea sp.]|nr:GNAT family N-acetyltransferase [Eudoraea sp.]